MEESFTKFKVYEYKDVEKSYNLYTRESRRIQLFEVKSGGDIRKIQSIDRRGDTRQEDLIKYGGWVNASPALFYVITNNNDIEFYKAEDKEMLTKVSLKSLLFGVDQKLYDPSYVSVLIRHFYDNNFVLAVENYVMLLNIHFDKRKQCHLVNFVTESPLSNQVYIKRLSRFTKPACYEIFITTDLGLIVKTSENILRFNGFFSDAILTPV